MHKCSVFCVELTAAESLLRRFATSREWLAPLKSAEVVCSTIVFQVPAIKFIILNTQSSSFSRRICPFWTQNSPSAPRSPRTRSDRAPHHSCDRTYKIHLLVYKIRHLLVCKTHRFQSKSIVFWEYVLTVGDFYIKHDGFAIVPTVSSQVERHPVLPALNSSVLMQNSSFLMQNSSFFNAFRQAATAASASSMLAANACHVSMISAWCQHNISMISALFSIKFTIFSMHLPLSVRNPL